MPRETSIRIIPKAKAKTPFWANFLVGFCFFLIAAAFGLFIFFNQYNSSLKEKTKELDSRLELYQAPQFLELQNRFLQLAEKVELFSKVLKTHKYVSELFWFLKWYCHPQTQFSDLSFSSANYMVKLSGLTENFRTLGEQLLVFFASENVKDLQMPNVSLDKAGKVRFELTFYLSEVLFVR